MIWYNIILKKSALKEFGPPGMVKNRITVNQKGAHFLLTGLNIGTDEEIKVKNYSGRLQRVKVQCFPDQLKEMDKLLNVRNEPMVIITIDQIKSGVIYGLDYGLKFKNYDGTWLTFEGVNDTLPALFVKEENLINYFSQNL